MIVPFIVCWFLLLSSWSLWEIQFDVWKISGLFSLIIKFIYIEKATQFCEIFILLLTVCTVVKSKVKISQNFVAFSEYMNFRMMKGTFLFSGNWKLARIELSGHIRESFRRHPLWNQWVKKFDRFAFESEFDWVFAGFNWWPAQIDYFQNWPKSFSRPQP